MGETFEKTGFSFKIEQIITNYRFVLFNCCKTEFSKNDF